MRSLEELYLWETTGYACLFCLRPGQLLSSKLYFNFYFEDGMIGEVQKVNDTKCGMKSSVCMILCFPHAYNFAVSRYHYHSRRHNHHLAFIYSRVCRLPFYQQFMFFVDLPTFDLPQRIYVFHLYLGTPIFSSSLS